MGADGGAKLGHTAAGQLEILVHVVVYRCNKLLIIAVEQRIARSAGQYRRARPAA